MPTSRSRRIPKYRHYKPKDLAVVRIDGKDHYLGKHNTPESKETYARLIAEHFRSGDISPRLAHLNGDDVSINEIVAKYWTEHVETYHTKDGKPTDRQYHVRLALHPLCSLYGRTPASEFGPKKLKAVRETMIDGRIRERGGSSRWAGLRAVRPQGRRRERPKGDGQVLSACGRAGFLHGGPAARPRSGGQRRIFS